MLLVHLFVCFLCVSFCPFFSSSWSWELVAVCDCGTPWTFVLTFFNIHIKACSSNFIVTERGADNFVIV